MPTFKEEGISFSYFSTLVKFLHGFYKYLTNHKLPKQTYNKCEKLQAVLDLLGCKIKRMKL